MKMGMKMGMNWMMMAITMKIMGPGMAPLRAVYQWHTVPSLSRAKVIKLIIFMLTVMIIYFVKSPLFRLNMGAPLRQFLGPGGLW